jgi:fibronectin type 3 domain-containing protein
MTFVAIQGAGKLSDLETTPTVCCIEKNYFRLTGRAVCRLASILLISCFAVMRAGASDPTSVTLAWNPSADATVTGYRLYYGAASGQYTNSVAAGNTTSCTVTGLVNGTTYFFATTAHNASGVESPFSNEVSYSVAFSRLQITAQDATGLTLAIEGVAGRPYNIEASENLGNWAVIGTITTSASGRANFKDTQAGNLSRRFYRLRDGTW